MRKLLPLTLVTSLAMFGCTLMNRTPGNGQPFSATPSMSPATTPGSSSGNIPMSSSYLSPASNSRLSADRAAAIMREHQAYNGRFLGYLNPTPMVHQATQIETGQLIPPATVTNPQFVIPSSNANAPITVTNASGQIVVTNVKNQ